LADCLILLEDRLVVLVILSPKLDAGPVQPGTAPSASRVQEEPGQVQIPLLSRHSVELRQAHLDDLVAGRSGVLAGPEHSIDQVRVLDGHVKERPLSSSLVVRDRCLVEMPTVVEFVASRQIAPPFRAVPPTQALGAVRTAGVQVAVVLLCRRDLLYYVVQIPIQVGGRVQHQGI